jgi:hypothetical protein
MEKLLFGAFLSRDELDVIDEKNIHSSKFISKLIHLIKAERVDEFIGEFLCGQIADLLDIGKDPLLKDVDADRMEEMSLSQTDSTVEEQGIIILCGHIGDSEARRVGELVARTDDKVIKRIFGVENRSLGGRLSSLLLSRKRLMPFLLGDFFIFNQELDLARLLQDLGEDILNLRRIVLVDPIFEEAVRDLEFYALFFDRDKLDGFDPNVKILLTDPFFQRVYHFRPQAFHELDLDGLRRDKRVVYGLGGIDPNRISSLFLVSYKTLFTMFPQMWITEKPISSSMRGKKMRMALI